MVDAQKPENGSSRLLDTDQERQQQHSGQKGKCLLCEFIQVSFNVLFTCLVLSAWRLYVSPIAVLTIRSEELTAALVGQWID